MLELVGLGSRINHYPRDLSGEEQRRVAISHLVKNVSEELITIRHELVETRDNPTATKRGLVLNLVIDAA